MDVFDLRQQLIRDYAEYVRSFLEIGDPRIREHVDRSLADGLLWPHPLIQLNPAFEPADTIDELVDQAVLHPECRKIFSTHKRGQGRSWHTSSTSWITCFAGAPAAHQGRCRLPDEYPGRQPARPARREDE